MRAFPASTHRSDRSESAALTGGSQTIVGPEEDARSFIEDLIQLNRIAHQNVPDAIPAELIAPGEAAPGHKTHYLVKEDGKVVLKRHHFDCGFHGCKHCR